MTTLQRLPGDHSLAFLADGYTFGTNRFERLGDDAFATRLLGRRVVVARGIDAVRFFYEGGRFTREGSMPRSVLHSLQDEGSVQTLTGDSHEKRKEVFVSALGDESRRRLVEALATRWAASIAEWRRSGETLDLHDASSRLLTAAALEWIGVRLGPVDTEARADEFIAMIDGAGSFGQRNWRGRTLRHRTERWARELVRRTRDAYPGADDGSPLARIVFHRDEAGLMLDEDVAAVEILNLLRPTVAAARFIVFGALAIHHHPVWRERLRGDDAIEARAFAEEVRRTTPFFPVVVGTAARPLEWRGHLFAPGDWMMVDLFGTNRHPELWGDPLVFRPERFLEAPERSRWVVAQGTGEMVTSHHCPGEAATVDLVAASARALASTDFTVDGPARVSLRRFPALPTGGLRVRFS